MLLAIDIGNTHTVVGVFGGTNLAAHWRIMSSHARTADETWVTIRSFFDAGGIPLKEITRVGISSVVPNLTEIFEIISRKYLNIEPVTISSDLALGIRIDYSDPRSVGADRLCNAIAGYSKHGGPLIVVDFGTATTFDVISTGGDYLGGVICLGLESSASELHRRAAKLPKIELKFPPSIIGKDTTSSMQAGTMIGAIDSLEGIVRRIQNELGADTKVIATGGLAQTIAQHTRVINAVEPTLVLDGVRMILEKTQAKAKE